MLSETITLQGESGILVNRSEIVSFSGPIPISDYPINEDPNPEIVRKQADPSFIDYVQEVYNFNCLLFMSNCLLF